MVPASASTVQMQIREQGGPISQEINPRNQHGSVSLSCNLQQSGRCYKMQEKIATFCKTEGIKEVDFLQFVAIFSCKMHRASL